MSTPKPSHPTTRRDFLRNAALGAGALCVVPSVNLLRGLAPEPIRVGIIGTGDRGGGLLTLCNSIPDLDVVAVSDLIDFRLAAAVQATEGRAKAYIDYRQLLERSDLEAVLVCTPFGLHGLHATEGLDAGKHVYCEKTMVRGAAGIAQVLAKAASLPKQVFQTGHQYHSSGLYRRVKEMVEKGYLGELTAVHCQWNRNGSWRRPVPADRPELERLINWRMYEEHSGGLVAELMSHQLDFVNWITGQRPAKMSGHGGIEHYKDGRETFDNVHLLAEYTGGLDASFSCTTTNKFGDYEVRVLGSRATVVLGYESGRIYHESTTPAELGTVDGVSGATVTAWAQGEGVAIDADGSDPTRQALEAFAKSIRSGVQPESDVHTGALAARCVDLGLRAVKGGATLAWDFAD